MKLWLPTTLKNHPVVNVSWVKPYITPVAGQAEYLPMKVAGSDKVMSVVSLFPLCGVPVSHLDSEP
ncbi:hypothetical protein ID866_12120 [Astraeus odoratus]|nr:hypothetical protein ID866_12120 [Astraeus odoratus]